MDIVIQTSGGTYIVPSSKEYSLITWLQANAIKNGSPFHEVKGAVSNQHETRTFLTESPE